MNNGYKNAMNKFVLSDEFKNKIVQNAALNAKDREFMDGYNRAVDKLTLSDVEKQRVVTNVSLHYKKRLKRIKIIRYASNIAACLIIGVVSIPAVNHFNRFSQGNVEIAPISGSNTEHGDLVPAPTIDTGNTDAISADTGATTQTATTDIPEKSMNEEINTVDNSYKTQDAASKTDESATNIDADNQALDIEQASPKQDVNTVSPPDNDMEGDLVLSASPFGLDNNSELSEPPVDTNNGNDTPMFQDFESVDALREHMGYLVRTPQYLPEGYLEDYISLCFGTLIEIGYTNCQYHMTYRTERGNSDVSGDYNEYENVNIAKVNDIEAVIKTDETIGTLATWADSASSYSVSVDAVLKYDEVVKIIEGVE